MSSNKKESSQRDFTLGALFAATVIGVGAWVVHSLTSQEAEPVDYKPVSDEAPDVCCICLDKKANCLFLPCRHMRTCMACSAKVDKCPNCREVIAKKEGPVFY